MDEYDVIVLGTGSAGLIAAIKAHDEGARVAIFEKADKVGGTTAWSGGMVWIPCNHHMAEAGIADSRRGRPDLPRLAVVRPDRPGDGRGLRRRRRRGRAVAGGQHPREVPDHPGLPRLPLGAPGRGRTGGRSLEYPLFSFKELGDWADRVTTGRQLAAIVRQHITMSETPWATARRRGIRRGDWSAARVARPARRRATAWSGVLLKGCLDRGIEPRTDAPRRRADHRGRRASPACASRRRASRSAPAAA